MNLRLSSRMQHRSMEGLNSFDIGFKSSWDHDTLSLTPLSENISSRGLWQHLSFLINFAKLKQQKISVNLTSHKRA